MPGLASWWHRARQARKAGPQAEGPRWGRPVPPQLLGRGPSSQLRKAIFPVWPPYLYLIYQDLPLAGAAEAWHKGPARGRQT